MNNAYTWLEDSHGRLSIAQNKLYNGEAWGHKSLVGLRHFPIAGMSDEEWWMRNVDPSKARSGGEINYHKPFAFPTKEDFHVERPTRDHSRRVFGHMAGIKHSFSEGNFHTLREEPRARRHMAKRYADVMGISPKHGPAAEGASASRSPKCRAAVVADGCANDSPSKSALERQRCQRQSAGEAAPAGDASAENSGDSWEKRMAEKIRKQPKWGGHIATPKAEDRAMASGKRFVVLPNPRLQMERVPAAIHGPSPPRYARAKRISSLNYDGEAYHFEA